MKGKVKSKKKFLFIILQTNCCNILLLLVIGQFLSFFFFFQNAYRLKQLKKRGDRKVKEKLEKVQIFLKKKIYCWSKIIFFTIKLTNRQTKGEVYKKNENLVVIVCPEASFSSIVNFIIDVSGLTFFVSIKSTKKFCCNL